MMNTLRQLGYEGTAEGVEIFPIGWNKTVYSSCLLKQEGELDDMIRKAVEERGYTYGGEKLGGTDFVPGSSFAMMDVFMVYYFTQ